MKSLGLKLVYIVLGYVVSSLLVTFFSWESLREKLPVLRRFYYPSINSNLRMVKNSESVSEESVTILPEKRLVSDVYESSAVLEPENEIWITSKIAGRISKILVKEGDSVKKGQLLLKLEDDIYQSDIKKYQAALEVANSYLVVAREKLKIAETKIEIKLRDIDKLTDLIVLHERNLENAKENFQKKRELWKAGSISLLEIEKSQAEIDEKKILFQNLIRERESLLTGLVLSDSDKVLDFTKRLQSWKQTNTELEQAEYSLQISQVKIAKENLENAKKILSETEIKAPIDGTISKILVNLNGLVPNNTSPILEMFSGTNLNVAFAISEMDLEKFNQSKKIQFFLPNQSTIPIEATVHFISPYLEKATHSILIKARITGKKIRLLPGMYGTILMELDTKQQKLYIPNSVIKGDKESGFFVYVKVGSQTKKRFIRILSGELEAEVISGLEETDQILLNQMVSVKD